MADGQLIVEADGGSRGNPGPAGYGALVRGPGGTVLAERAGYLGETTNNVAEYTALVEGLRAVATIDPEARVEVRMDSRLVVEQMSGRWKIKHADMRRLADEASNALPPSKVRYTWIPRAQNVDADRLANEAMDTRNPRIVRDFPSAPDTQAMPDGAPAASTNAGDIGDEALAGASSGGPRRRMDPAAATTLVLVRHGETALTETGAYSGAVVPGPSLTSRGRIQAAHAADLVRRIGRDAWPDLPPVQAVVSSPIARAMETAGAVGRRLGVHVAPDARLAECDFGTWESLTAEQISAGWPGALERWYETGTEAAPGGESVRDVGERSSSALEAAVDSHPGRAVAVVGHTVQIRAAVGRALEAPPSRWSTFRIPPGSLTILRVWPAGFTEVVAVGVPSDL